MKGTQSRYINSSMKFKT